MLRSLSQEDESRGIRLSVCEKDRNVGSIYVNSRFIRTVMVSRSRSIPDSTGGSIKNTGIVVLSQNL